MNTGMQDAFNLGWKLALVARGQASPHLLLVRPDGYIAFWGQFGATEALRTYVQELFVGRAAKKAPIR